MSALKLLSINVGMPREVDWHGRLVRTSIFKSPVLGAVRVATLNLEAMSSQISPCTAGSIRQSMPTHLSTTHSGASKFPA